MKNLVKGITKRHLENFKYNTNADVQDQIIAAIMPDCELIEMPDMDNDGDRPKHFEGKVIGLMKDAKYIWKTVQEVFEENPEIRESVTNKIK